MIWILGGLIGFGLIVLVIVPVGLVALLGVKPENEKDWRDRVAGRYQRLYRFSDVAGAPRAIFAWMFARQKMRLDPMFLELPDILKSTNRIEAALDIGCGVGVAACGLLEWYPNSKIYGVDPAAGRVRVARAAFGNRGDAFVAGAPDFLRHGIPEHVDVVMVLDVIHFISDTGLAITLERIRSSMNDTGLLVIRSIVPPTGSGSIWWKIARFRRAITGLRVHHRNVEKIRAAIEAGGFAIQKCEVSGGNPEMHWFVATAGAATE
jgi:SAM-dependent methyltransferase